MRIYTFLWFFLISCAFAQNATQCPTYECGALPDSTCASVTQNGIIVNQDGCPDQQGCSLAALVSDPNTVRNITCEPLSNIPVQPPTRLLQDANTTTVIAEPTDAGTAVDLGNVTTTTANVTTTTQPVTTEAVPVDNTTTPVIVNVTTTAENATEPTPPPTSEVNTTSLTTTEVNTTATGVNSTTPATNVTAPATNVTTTTTNVTTTDTNATAITTTTTYNCSARSDQKNLQSGSYPKECTSADDCLLEDGTANECVCGADGKQYCRPDINSDVFDDFWQLCEDGKMNSTSYSNWEIYNEYYVFVESAPSCMEDIFPELITANAAESYASDESEFGMLLGLSGLIWIVLLS